MFSFLLFDCIQAHNDWANSRNGKTGFCLQLLATSHFYSKKYSYLKIVPVIMTQPDSCQVLEISLHYVREQKICRQDRIDCFLSYAQKRALVRIRLMKQICQHDRYHIMSTKNRWKCFYHTDKSVLNLSNAFCNLRLTLKPEFDRTRLIHQKQDNEHLQSRIVFIHQIKVTMRLFMDKLRTKIHNGRAERFYEYVKWIRFHKLCFDVLLFLPLMCYFSCFH